MAAEYNHRILIAVVLLLLVFSNYYTTPVLGRGRYMNSTTQKEKQDHLIHEEKQDQIVRRSLALAALDPDPTKFLYLVRKYYENTYLIHPETKILVRVYVNPRIEALLRCRRCARPAPITEADWKRYEAAVKRPTTHLWITPLDVSKCRLWLEANPPL